ncbi:MAG: ATP-dependent chaperone ClpB [Synechococcus sp. TMED19]|nr:MAG: ATP-dependent chaperone ClpB [Synechococcus sp. TMED19]
MRLPDSSFSLTTDPQRFSELAWDLLLGAQDEAKRWRHGDLDVEHLVLALFQEARLRPLLEELRLSGDDLRDDLEDFCARQPTRSSTTLYVGEDLELLLDQAEQERLRAAVDSIEPTHLLLALAKDERLGSALLRRQGLDARQLESLLQPRPAVVPPVQALQSEAPPRVRQSSPSAAAPTPLNDGPVAAAEAAEPGALAQYGRDLTALARDGELDPVIGRDADIRRLIQVLSRRSKNNPVLIGEAGVGKTAVAELLAQRMVAGEVPDSLKGRRLISLDLGALIAGAKYRGQFEERLRRVLEEIASCDEGDEGVVLFIDEIHTLVNGDRAGADAGSVLKPALARGELRCIGATTVEEYRRTLEKDPVLNRRFQQLLIKEPPLDVSLEILRGVRERYELHHGVSIGDDALEAAVRLADRYISDRCLPDKAIDLIDESAAELKMEATSKPAVVEVAEAELRRIERILLAAEQAPMEERVQHQQRRSEALDRLENLQDRWQQERQQLQDLRQLQQREEELRHAIAEAERLTEWEEMARLQVELEHEVQRRRQELEQELQQPGRLLRDLVSAQDIADVVARTTGIPVQRLLAGERQKLLELEKCLGEKVLGQPDAVTAVAAAIRRARAGMKDARRPVGSFLFLGPTGVGKTELARTLAANLFDEEEALVRLDMSEFMERNAVARLIGAPPGYVGYEEGGQLTEAVRLRPYAVVLLDEVEKAHPEVFNLLLQVLDDGRLSDSQGRSVDFRHTVVVMTSNLASRAILSHARDGDVAALEAEVDRALGAQFRPEFLNRIDEVIRFRPLQPEDLAPIVRLQLADLDRLLQEQALQLHVDDAVVEWLARESFDPEYGARPLRRLLRRRLENPLATELLEDRYGDASGVAVQLDDGKLIFVPVL